MTKHKYQHILLLVLVLALASCVTGPSRGPLVPAGYLYESRYLNIRAPGSGGWHLVNSSPAGMSFARSGAEQGESVVAMVIMFSLAQTKDSKEFLSLYKRVD